jgi:arylformamidase
MHRDPQKVSAKESTPAKPLPRRAVLAAGACLALGAGLSFLRPALAQAVREKGPRVFLDYDQAELDAAYNQSVWAPNMKQILARFVSDSDLVRSRLGAPRRLAYGQAGIEQLDIYATSRPNAPISVFLHGGAWRAERAKDYGFPAENFVSAGAHYIAPDFSSVLDTGGDLMVLADQARRAVAWCWKNAASFGGDASQLYVCGHSSGAHLAGVVAVTDWQRDFGMPADAVKGYVCISGMYELQPVRLSSRSSYVKFTDATVEALSSQRHLERLNAPVTVVYGTYETPEFQRQNREFAEALRKAGKPVKLVAATGYNHFEVMETLANPYAFAGRAALEQMRLSPG